MSKTVGIVVTVVSALCCGCMAIFACIFGGIIASGMPFNSEVNGVNMGQQTYPQPVGFALLCVSVILIIIPVVVGFFSLRSKPAPAAAPLPQNYNDPIPPAS